MSDESGQARPRTSLLAELRRALGIRDYQRDYVLFGATREEINRLTRIGRKADVVLWFEPDEELAGAEAALLEVWWELHRRWEDAGRPEVMTAYGGGPICSREIHDRLTDVRRHRDDGRWRAACASYRWVRGDVAPEPGAALAVRDRYASARVLHSAMQVGIAASFGVPMGLLCGHGALCGIAPPDDDGDDEPDPLAWDYLGGAR